MGRDRDDEWRWHTIGCGIFAICEKTTTPVPRLFATRGALLGGQPVAGRLRTT